MSMEIFTALQKRVIKYPRKTELKQSFFFTGDSALAHYYLIHRYSDSLVFFTGEEDKVRLIRDLIITQDSSFRFKPVLYDDKLEFSYDNEIDIACNIFSALINRPDVKDFVDLYFLAKEFREFEEILKMHAKNISVLMITGLRFPWIISIQLKNYQKSLSL